ncbi:hypothetical protein F6X42_12910 [Paraburkholderia sp. WC7.3b]|uniref:Uncharacterized protein n=1 Tax=Paraburkholderia podalyriae TaxID=1938811 RepID=A0ABR7PNB9_9BURK|nr:hypothetical protein [Paraburkholderia podalyriae]
MTTCPLYAVITRTLVEPRCAISASTTEGGTPRGLIFSSARLRHRFHSVDPSTIPMRRSRSPARVRIRALISAVSGAMRSSACSVYQRSLIRMPPPSGGRSQIGSVKRRRGPFGSTTVKPARAKRNSRIATIGMAKSTAAFIREIFVPVNASSPLKSS